MSYCEELFAKQCGDFLVTEPRREFRFSNVRKYSFDFCWPDYMIAVEIEGGVWSGGRHTRPKGFIEDMTKYNLATSLGWSVYRFHSKQVENMDAIIFIRGVIWKTK